MLIVHMDHLSAAGARGLRGGSSAEPSPETATTTDLADIALYVNNKVCFGACFCCRIITDIQGA